MPQGNVHIVVPEWQWWPPAFQGRQLICVIYCFAALGPWGMLAFLLTFLDVIQIATPSGKESTPFDVASFDFSLSVVEWRFLIPASGWDAGQGRGNSCSLLSLYQQILILRTRVELKCLSPELRFQGLNYKSNFSFKALIIFQLPLPAQQPQCAAPSCCCISWFMPLSWLRCHLTISLAVIMDGIFAAYLFLSSAHLDSHWFCLVNNLTGYPWHFFPLGIVPALISLSQIALGTQCENFIFLLTEMAFHWHGPKSR